MKQWLLLVPCLTVAPLAGAQALSGAFVGYGAGSYAYRETSAGLVIIDDTASSWRAFGGYEIKRYFAVEGSWGRTGSLRGSYDENIPGYGIATFDVEGKYETYTIRAVGMLPLKRFKLVGGGGYYNTRLDLNVRVRGLPGEINDNSGTDDGTTLFAGLQYDLNVMGVRFEYEWFDQRQGTDASQVTINLLFKF
jgi:opacity protein-like surface antigen